MNNRVPNGVTVFGRDSVSDVMPDPHVDYLIENAYDAFNERRRFGGPSRMPGYKPHEVRLPEDNDVRETVLWLGKGVVGRSSADFVMIDADLGSRFDRATVSATEKLRKYNSIGSFGFAFFVQPEALPESQTANRDLLRECVAELIVPTLDIVVVPSAGHIYSESSADKSVQELAHEAGIVIPPSEIYRTDS